MTKKTTTAEVGYRKPPVHTRFQKGRSGNPRGRPKRQRSLAADLLKALNEKILIKYNGKSRWVTKLEAGFIQLANKLASGDINAFKNLAAVLRTFASEELKDFEKALKPMIVNFIIEE